ncbi:MAG: hypothetical protein HYT87_09690 [Nitrospirae bacterium]|nr:hypothetical protein [Nitrospirota bacterium]
MPTATNRHLAASTFVTGYLAAFLYAYLVPTRLLWYEPVERVWRFAASGSLVGMDFYGRIILALTAGTVASAVATGLSRSLRANFNPKSFLPRMMAGYAVILTVSALVALAWLFSHRSIIPPDLP